VSPQSTLQARLTLDDAHRVLRRDIGPINLEFTVPMLCASRLQVRYLQIMKPEKPGQPAAYRWVRYVTTSNSYVVRP
jgi:AP-4 complex subunit mu-1